MNSKISPRKRFKHSLTGCMAFSAALVAFPTFSGIDYSYIDTSWEAENHCKESSFSLLTDNGHTPTKWHSESYVFGSTIETKGQWHTEQDNISVNCSIKQGSKAKSQRMKMIFNQ